MERVDLSDSDGEFEYAEVDVSSDDDLGPGAVDDDPLATLKAPLKTSKTLSGGAGGAGAGAGGGTRSLPSAGGVSMASGGSGAAAGKGRGAPVAETVTEPVVVDDFIRNFLLNAGLHRSLDAFNTEWCVRG